MTLVRGNSIYGVEIGPVCVFVQMTGFHLNFREYLYTIFYPSLLILKDEDFLKAAFDVSNDMENLEGAWELLSIPPICALQE